MDAEQRRERAEIEAHYLPNLTNIEECIIGDSHQIVKPDHLYVDENGKETPVFYNNHFEILRDAVFRDLEALIAFHPYVPGYCRSFYIDIARSSRLEGIPEIPGPINNLMLWMNPDVHSKALKLATICANLNFYIDIIGNEITPEHVGAVRIETSLTEPARFDVLTEGVCRRVEAELCDIANSRMTEVEKINALGIKLDEFKFQINPEAGRTNLHNFCFALNRTNTYLTRYSGSLNRDYHVLSAMDQLSRKINQLLVQYRFKHCENSSPMLEIRIDRCKVLVDKEELTMIYLERPEIERFLASLYRTSESKAANITRRYSAEGLTSGDLIQIVRELNPVSVDLDHLEA